MLFSVVTFVILLVYVGAACVPPNAAICPASCECDNFAVICGTWKLSRVPDNLPNNVRTLNLSYDNIQSLQVSDFAGCSRLEVVDLSFNSLKQVDRGVFKSTPNLRRLSLNGNQLQSIDFDLAPLGELELLDLSFNAITFSTLPISTFRGLRKLEFLDLTYNNCQEEVSYNDNLFLPLKNLKILKIDGLPNKDFPKGIADLSLLNELSITGCLNIITNETFAVFETTNLTTLSIRTDKYLVWIEPMSFAHFKCLKYLDLSYNSNLTLRTASRAWFGLQYTQVEELRLNYVTPDSSTYKELDDAFFTHLNLTNITMLELEGNSLAYIKPVFSKYLPNLMRLNLAYNQLYNSHGLVDDCANLARLRALLLNNQKCPSRNNNRQYIEFAKQRRFNRNGDIGNMRCETYTKLRSQQLTAQINEQYIYRPPPPQVLSISSYPVYVALASSLEEMNLFSSLFVDYHTLPPLNITRGGENLQKINLGGNGIHQVVGPIVFASPPNNLVVDLSRNQIECFNPELFTTSGQQSKVRVTQLHLNRNILGYQLRQDVEGVTFNHYEFLTVLDLTHNGISYLNAKAFQRLFELEELILPENVIRRVDFEFKHMTKLTLLDLSYNRITSLNTTQMQTFTEMFSKNYSQLRLRLKGNPIQCSCDSLPFLHWMNQNQQNLDDFTEISCFFYDESVNFTRLSDYILVDLDYVCWTSVAVIVSGVLLGLTIVLIGTSVFCYRHRWEIRYACIKLTQKGQRYQRLVNEAVHYTYDAFVVYDSGDRNWVHNALVPHLENVLAEDNQSSSAYPDQFSQKMTGNLRLCVHERDFPPGEDILANIWSKMERSRKVILIISKNFTRSRYCEYEMNLARMQSFEQGRNVIVPIVLEMPEMDKVSDCLSWLMRKVTYIEWPKYESDRDEFWDKIHETVSIVKSDSMSCMVPVESLTGSARNELENAVPSIASVGE